MKVIDGELHRMATDGPSAEELAAAKRFLIGSYPLLRFDSSSAIAASSSASSSTGSASIM